MLFRGCAQLSAFPQLKRRWAHTGAGAGAHRRGETQCVPTAQGRVLVHEVSPRDGLQNEPVLLDVHGKMRLLQALCQAQPYSIEVTSFVRADRVPQLSDADELCARMVDTEWFHQARAHGTRFAGLVPNLRGLDRFLGAREQGALDSVSVITSATDGHSRANVGKDVASAIAESARVVRAAVAEGVGVRGYVSMAFGCPIDGETNQQYVEDIVQQYAEAGADVIVIADTVGYGTPEQVEQTCRRALRLVGDGALLGLHMHDTRGRAAENCAVALDLGFVHFDSAVAGCGGCPFAPGAAGNLATEDLLDLCESLRHHHGMSRTQVADAAAVLRKELLVAEPML